MLPRQRAPQQGWSSRRGAAGHVGAMPARPDPCGGNGRARPQSAVRPLRGLAVRTVSQRRSGSCGRRRGSITSRQTWDVSASALEQTGSGEHTAQSAPLVRRGNISASAPPLSISWSFMGCYSRDSWYLYGCTCESGSGRPLGTGGPGAEGRAGQVRCSQRPQTQEAPTRAVPPVIPAGADAEGQALRPSR